MSRTRTLLSVDWDMFFPRLGEASNAYIEANGLQGQHGLYDWGHAEHAFGLTVAWGIRALDFHRNGLPLPRTTGEERSFWERFQIAPDCPLYVAESHASIAHLFLTQGEAYGALGKETWVCWSYDAHHDAYVDRNQDSWQSVTCENWAVVAATRGMRTRVRYPVWRDLDHEHEPFITIERAHDTPMNRPPGPIDAVFICRSGAWVSPWCDAAFVDFVRACPAAEHLRVLGKQADQPLLDPMQERSVPHLGDFPEYVLGSFAALGAHAEMSKS